MFQLRREDVPQSLRAWFDELREDARRVQAEIDADPCTSPECDDPKTCRHWQAFLAEQAELVEEVIRRAYPVALSTHDETCRGGLRLRFFVEMESTYPTLSEARRALLEGCLRPPEYDADVAQAMGLHYCRQSRLSFTGKMVRLLRVCCERCGWSSEYFRCKTRGGP